MQLYPLSTVGRALIFQTAWNDPRAEVEANAVLDEDRHQARQTICQHRMEALQEFKEAFAIMKKKRARGIPGGKLLLNVTASV